MSTISVCFKRITIMFLIFSFLLVSFFGVNINPANAQGALPPNVLFPPTPPAKTTPPAPADTCAKKCPQQTWAWKVDDNIQSALCNTQCAIIGWEASIIGWVIEKVLYPALGLCDDKKDNCPKLPAATTP